MICSDYTLTTQEKKKRKVDSVFCFLFVKQAKQSTEGAKPREQVAIIW